VVEAHSRMLLQYLLLAFSCPGIVIHELAHKEFCRYYQIPVKETCYFQFGDPAGYVVHARPHRYSVSFMISIAPVFVNTTIAFLSGVLFAYLATPFDGVGSLIQPSPLYLVGMVLSGWIGIATGTRAFPSQQDANVIWEQTRENWYNPFVMIAVPITGVIKILNWFRFIHLHTITGFAVFVGGILLWLNINQVYEYGRAMFGL